MKLLRRLMSDARVEKKYVRAGAEFGDAVSYSYMGECVGFELMLDRLESWEREYSSRGFKTVSVDRFIELGGYGVNIDSFLGQKRTTEEKPIFYAQIYRQRHLGKISPAVNLTEILTEGKTQIGSYALPSTENL